MRVMAQALTLAERETIVRFSDDPEDLMTFETFNKKHALRLIRDGATVQRTATRGKATYWTLRMPKDWFRWPRKPSERRREAGLALLEKGFKPGVGYRTGQGPSGGDDVA